MTEKNKDVKPITISFYYNKIEPFLNFLSKEEKGDLLDAICQYFKSDDRQNFEYDFISKSVELTFNVLRVDFDMLIKKREKNSYAGEKSGIVRQMKREQQQADTIQTDGSGTHKAIQSTTKPVLSQRVDHTSAEPSTLDLKEISRKRKAEGAERIEEIAENYRKQREKGQTDDNTGAEMLAMYGK